MQLTLTFETIEEFDLFRAAAAAEAAGKPQEAPKAMEVPEPAEPPKKAGKARSAPRQEPQPEPQPEPPRKTVALPDLRQALAQLNKAAGRNVASEIIKEVTGKDKLTDVEPGEYAAIIDRVREKSHAG